MREKRIIDVLVYIFIGMGMGIFFLPFFWMILSGLKTQPEVVQIPMTFFPKKFQWHNYVQVFTVINFGKLFLNSIIVALCVTCGVLLTSLMAGYALAKINFAGRYVLFLLILSTMMIPFYVAVIPLYFVIKTLGWLNSYQALVIPAMVSPLGIFLARQFMLTLPNELIDAARIDGCSEFGIFWKIVLPLTKPVTATLTIFTFMFNWDSFLWPLLVLSSSNMYTLPIGLRQLQLQTGVARYHLMLAGASIAVIPVLVVFLFAQKQIIQGITLTGIKG